MRVWGAAAARRACAATAVAGVSLLLVTACNDAETPDPSDRLVVGLVDAVDCHTHPSPSRDQERDAGGARRQAGRRGGGEVLGRRRRARSQPDEEPQPA